MNLGTIRSEVREELQETTAELWTDAELDQYANDGCILIQKLLEWYEDTANILSVVGQQDYSMPSNMMTLKRVTWDRKFLPQTTHYELDKHNRTWRAAENNDPIRFFIHQWDTLSSYPKPVQAGTGYTFDSELGVITLVEDGGVVDPDVTIDAELGVVIAVEDSDGGQIRFTSDLVADPFTLTSAELGALIGFSVDELNFALYFAAMPDTMDSDTDVPQMHQCAHPALVPYVCYRAFIREGPEQNIELAKAYFQDFGDWMEQVFRVRGRQFPDKVFHLQGIEKGTMFENRLSAIGGPVLQNLLPSYPMYQV